MSLCKILYQNCVRTIQQSCAFALVSTGVLCTIIASFMPMWKMTISHSGDTATTRILRGGLFFTCQVSKSSGWNQCENDEPLLTTVKDLHAVWSLVTVSILADLLAMWVSRHWFRRDFCTCNSETLLRQVTNVTISLCAGIMFMVAGVLYIASMIWASSIIRGFHNSVATEKRQVEWDDGIYFGVASGLFRLVAGGIIFHTCIQRCCYDTLSCCQGNNEPEYHSIPLN